MVLQLIAEAAPFTESAPLLTNAGTVLAIVSAVVVATWKLTNAYRDAKTGIDAGKAFSTWVQDHTPLRRLEDLEAEMVQVRGELDEQGAAVSDLSRRPKTEPMSRR